MKLLIAGHSALDTIITGDKVTSSPGGIIYNVLGVVACSKSDDNIFLLTGLDKSASEFAEVFTNCNLEFSSEIESVIRVELTLFEDKEREEKYLYMPGPLGFPPFDKLNDFNGILLNFISGNDFTLLDVEAIRKNYSGIMYADIHSLSRGINEEGEREFRLIPEISRWLKCFDVVQVNENELFTLSCYKREREIAQYVLEHGVKILIVTKGELGAGAYYLSEDELEYIFVSAEKVEVNNRVGCGDIFGAFFFYYYVEGKNILQALKNGIEGAGKIVEYSPGSAFSEIIEKLK